MAPTVTMPEPVHTERGPTVARAAAGSREWQAIYEEHGRAVYYLALRFLGDPARAEDATHDVFLKAFRKLDQFRGGSSLRTWLYRITINHCKNLVQTWHHRNVLPSADPSVWENMADHNTPLRVIETKELGERIQKTLDALPEEYRLMLLLVADEELSYEAVGELLGQTADSVRGKLYRARKAFVIEFDKTA
jgi:RNA polymerase sigma-70 factor (ECF subfamily)